MKAPWLLVVACVALAVAPTTCSEAAEADGAGRVAEAAARAALRDDAGRGTGEARVAEAAARAALRRDDVVQGTKAGAGRVAEAAVRAGTRSLLAPRRSLSGRRRLGTDKYECTAVSRISKKSMRVTREGVQTVARTVNCPLKGAYKECQGRCAHLTTDCGGESWTKETAEKTFEKCHTETTDRRDCGSRDIFCRAVHPTCKHSSWPAGHMPVNTKAAAVAIGGGGAFKCSTAAGYVVPAARVGSRPACAPCCCAGGTARRGGGKGG